MKKKRLSIDQYLQNCARFAGSDYGRLVRNQFKDNKGDSELGMLVAPTVEELEQLKKAVAIMTPQEKENADSLADEQIQKIAADAGVDPADLAIFINGYALHGKKTT